MERRERKAVGRKKTFALLLALALILTSAVLPGNENLLQNAAYAATSRQITLEASLTALNDRTSDKVALTIGVKENATEGVSGLQFQLQYPEEFTLIDTKEGDFFKGGVSFYGETDANPLFCGFGSHGSDGNREESTDKASGKLVTFIFEANTVLTQGQEYAFKILDKKREAFLLTSGSAGTPETVYFDVVNADTSIYGANGNGGEITTEEGTTKIKATTDSTGTAVVKQQLIAETLASGGDAIIDLTSGTAAETTEVEISKTAADLVAEKGKALIVQTNAGTLNFNTAAAASVNKNAEGENLLISVTKEDNILIGQETKNAVNFDVTAKLVNNAGEFVADVTNFGGGEVEVALDLPTSLQEKTLKCWNYTDTNCTPVEGKVSSDGSKFVFKTKHFSKYLVAEQETLDAFKADRHLSEGVTVSGTVTSFGDIEADVTINLIKTGETSATRTRVKKGNNTEYSLDGVAAGDYTLQILKKNHVTREYAVTVGSEAVVQDAKIYLLGDINGDGSITPSDNTKMLRHIKKTALLSGYELKCADINGDGSVTPSDSTKMLRHIKGTAYIW